MRPLKHTQRHHIVTLSCIGLIFLIAAMIQAQFVINWDVAWDIDVTRRLLEGGSYQHDFFDLNPPLIFFIYIPVILLQHLSLSVQAALCLYLFILIGISLWLCYFSIKAIFSNFPAYFSVIFLSSVAITLLIYPVDSLGQREHLLLIFTLPYFFLVAYRMQNNIPSVRYALAVGLFAGLGFAIKPYFLIPAIMIEIYYWYYKKYFLAWMRPETIMILAITVLHILVTLLFYSDYLSQVMPVALQFYYEGVYSSVFNYIFYYFLYIAVINLLFARLSSCKELKSFNIILTLGLFGFLLIYILQCTNWYYHYYPALSMAILLSITLLFMFREKIINFVLVFFLIMIIFSIPVYVFYDNYQLALSTKRDGATLVDYLKKVTQKKSLLFMTMLNRSFYSAVSEIGVIPSSRFLHPFWIPGVVKQSLKKTDQLTEKASHLKRFVDQLFIEDIKNRKPAFIFVDVNEYKGLFGDIPFNFLDYFLQYKAFANEWKHYRYLENIHHSSTAPANLYLWALYTADNIKDVNLQQFDSPTIILTGSGKTRLAYYVVNHFLMVGHFLHKPITRKIILTALEAQAFSSSQRGFIQFDRNPIFSAVLRRLLAYQKYNFDVYVYQS